MKCYFCGKELPRINDGICSECHKKGVYPKKLQEKCRDWFDKLLNIRERK